VEWTLLTYRLPSEPSRARVAVWREVRRSGALHLQQSVVVFPAGDAFIAAVCQLQAVITDVGGEATTFVAVPHDSLEAGRLLGLWNAARDEEYAELCGECAKFLAEIDHEFAIEKFTSAELDEEEAELDKLERWHGRIATRDAHAAANGPKARQALERCRAALARYADEVYRRTAPGADHRHLESLRTEGP
jgi:hypothetical protein